MRTQKATRDFEKSRHQILDAAFMQVFMRGFQGVSVDDIVKKTNLTKGAFYHHFPTKLDLGYALVEDIITPMIVERWIAPLEKFENPLIGILKQIKVLIGDADPKHLKWGCPLNNLVQEMAPVDPGFHKRLKSALHFWINSVETHLRRAKRNKILRKNVDTHQVAHFVVMSHEGFYGLIKGLDDPRAFNALYDSLKIYFQTLQNSKRKEVL